MLLNCILFLDRNIDILLPWVNVSHSVSFSLNSAVANSSSSFQTSAVKKRLRLNRLQSRISGRRIMMNKADFDSPVAPVIFTLRNELRFFTRNLEYSDKSHDGWKCLIAVSRLLELLVASAFDNADNKCIPGFAYSAISSLFGNVAENLEVLLQADTDQTIVVYPLLIVSAICLFAMPFHDTSSDLKVPMDRWLKILDAFSSSPLSSHLQMIFDFFLVTINFVTFSCISCNNISSSTSGFYALQNVNKLLLIVRSFIGSRLSKANYSHITMDVCSIMFRFLSYFIQAVRLHRVKIAMFHQSGSTVRSAANVTASNASGAHCCTLPAESCCIRNAIELGLDIVKAFKMVKAADNSEAVEGEGEEEEEGNEIEPTDELISELVRAGCCCCCFSQGSDLIASLLKEAAHREHAGLLVVDLCIRVFLDYYPRTEMSGVGKLLSTSVQGQDSTCIFTFDKLSNKNDILSEYVALPLSIFISNVKSSNDSKGNEDLCFQIARHILALTSTSAFSKSSQARRFLFRHLVGPLFDWVLAACFDRTDLFIARKALPIVLRILEDFLGDRDLSYFAEFASTTRLTVLSRLFEAGNAFCYIISLIRTLVRCSSGGMMFLDADAVAQLEVVKKVAVSTFLPAFYSVSKRLANDLYSTDERSEPISVTCHDLQIMSHCFFMLDESPYFQSAFVNQQSIEAFINLLGGLEFYISRKAPTSYSKEFIHLFSYVMGAMFRLKSLPTANTASFATSRFLSAPHEFYPLLRASFDSFCALLTPKELAIDHWCIIRDYKVKSALTKSESSDEENELEVFIGSSDGFGNSDGMSTANSDYDADEDEDDEYFTNEASDVDDDGDSAYREHTFGATTNSSVACYAGSRCYLAIELVGVLCHFIRHCRNCVDASCPTQLAELTCSLESVLAMMAQARIDSFGNQSIEMVFDLIFSGDLHPFLVNSEHNWHTIQHLLFCLLANLGSRHITPRHLCSIFKMTTYESVSLVSAAANCLNKLAIMSDFRTPPLCLRIGSFENVANNAGVKMRTSLPIRWHPGKCCFTFCMWVLLEGSSPYVDTEVPPEDNEAPMIPVCSFGSAELMITIFAIRRGKQNYDAYVDISLKGQSLRRKLYLPFARNRWMLLTIQMRDELNGAKDQYSVSVMATLDCEHVSTASAFWPVEEVPRTEVEGKRVNHFSPAFLAIGGSECVAEGQSNNRSHKYSGKKHL